MATSSGPNPPRNLDALDFEVTGFDEARKALDELPPGIAELERLRAEKAAAQPMMKKQAIDPREIERAKALLEAAGYRVVPPR